MSLPTPSLSLPTPSLSLPATLLMPTDLPSLPQSAILLQAHMRPVVGAPPADDGTLPGALPVDLDGSWSDHSSGLPHTLLSPQGFAARAGGLGIGRDTTLVVFDRHGIYTAPRVWFNLVAMGCTKVQVLDGGVPAWRASGGKCVPAEPPPVTEPVGTAVEFDAQVRADWLVDAAQVLAALEDPDVAVVDVRSRERFTGAVAEPRPHLARGHMPGAINLPFPEFLEGVRYRPAAHLREIFLRAGCEPQQRLIFSCGSGVTACIGLLAARLAGFEATALYDGAWAEWGARADLPTVLGP